MGPASGGFLQAEAGYYYFSYQLDLAQGYFVLPKSSTRPTLIQTAKDRHFQPILAIAG